MVRPHRTISKHCDEEGCSHSRKIRESLGRFEYNKPPRTHSELPFRPAPPFITVVRRGSRRFGTVEPPQTHSQLPFKPASPFITVVRGDLVWSNHHELTRTFPVDQLPYSSQWFEEVRWDRTAPNSINYWVGLVPSVKLWCQAWGGVRHEIRVVQPYQTSSNHSSRGNKDNRIISDEFGVVQLFRTCSYHSTTQVSRPAAEFDMCSEWFISSEPNRTIV